MDNRTAAAPRFGQNPDSASAAPYSPKPDRTVPDLERLARNGRMLNEAIKCANAAPDVREEKIAAIREKIASGLYKVDAARIARALIREEAGLFRD